MLHTVTKQFFLYLYRTQKQRYCYTQGKKKGNNPNKINGMLNLLPENDFVRITNNASIPASGCTSLFIGSGEINGNKQKKRKIEPSIL